MNATISQSVIFDLDLVREKEYWVDKLSQETGETSLLLDYERPRHYVADKGVIEGELPDEVCQKLDTLTNRSPFLLYTILMAALKTCLHKYTGNDRLVVGSPALKELGEANALAIVTDLNERLTFRDLLLKVRESLLEFYSHQNYPFDYLLIDLGLSETDDRCALFDVALALEALHGPLPDLKNDITITFAREGARIRGRIEYGSRLFARESMQRFWGHYLQVLSRAVDNKDLQLYEFQLLSETERRQILTEWNDTATDFPRGETIQGAFEAQVALTPDAVAVVCGDQQLTYGDLNRRANRMANYLQKIGAGPEVRVGLCVERSVEMIVGLLGIVKAGAAYVPLDPEYPIERLTFMLEDAMMPLLVTNERMMQRLQCLWVRSICMDSDRDQIDAQSALNPPDLAAAENLAYVMYTSGSTGQPKGVSVVHRGVIRLVKNINYADLSQAEVITQGSPISFDASTFEIWGSLLNGGKLALMPSRVPSVEEIADVIERHQANTVWLTSVLFQQVVDTHPACLRGVEQLLSGGDVLSLDRVRKIAAQLEGRKFIHAYGPTESTTFASFYQVTGRDPINHVLPIGRPVSNTTIYVLGKNLEPVPVGCLGEIYIGGEGLARDYLNRPDLTAQKYIPNSFSRDGERLYKAGDLGRYLPDGSIEFQGRIDHQVKVRGHRIELGEVEAALSLHPSVQDVVVMARQDDEDSKRLVGYVVARDATGLTVTDLRLFLQDRLPEYMIPTRFVFMDYLPMTSSGKVDRKALLPPDKARPELKEELIKARTSVEETLSRIWCEILGLDRIGIHDNFFEVGGDSILSIQIVARANHLGLRLTPKQMFEHQTIAALASVVSTEQEAEADQGIVSGPVPLTPIQHLFFEQEHPERHHWNMSVLLEVQPDFNAGVLEQVVGRLLSHHDALRLRYEQAPSGWHQFNQHFDGVPFTAVDISALPDHEQRSALEAAAAQLQLSLSLNAGPLIRVAHFDFGERNPGRLLVIIHHIVVDGVSWRIILEDLQTAYQQGSRGETIALPPKTTSFKQWAERQEEYAQSDELLSELPYWLAEPRRTVSSLPADFINSANRLSSVRTLSCTLDAAETQALLQEVPRAYRTQINDVLLTALAQSLLEWTGTDSVLIDLEGHGREEIMAGVDLSRTVGWFTTRFPILLDLRGADGPGEALKRIKEQLRNIPNHGIGYGMLRYLSKDPEVCGKLSALPESDVGFNYLGQFDQVLSDQSAFKSARESAGRARSLSGNWSHPLEVYGSVSGKRLQMIFAYSEDIYSHATIQRVIERFGNSLRAIISHCTSIEAGGRTPSDFPLARLDQATLNRLVATRRDIEDIYPLSPMQQGMLFHAFCEPDSDIYFEQMNSILHGEIDLAAFERAWQEVVNRNSILRTSFAVEGLVEPLQIVHKQARMPIEVLDWRGLSDREQERKLETFLREDRQRNLTIYEAPLARVTLIQFKEDKFGFIWSFHHVLMDGWSKSILCNELFALYESFCKGESLSLERSRSYRDYIAWLKSRNSSEAEAFWRRLLKGFTAPTPLIIDRVTEAPSGDAETYALQAISLSDEETEALQALARQKQATLNTLVQCAWALLLSRYSGEDDIVFGSTVSGRPPELAGVENMTGLFINTLPVRVRVGEGERLASLLKQVQDQQAEARQYDYSPLVDIQRWSEVPGGTPLFESIMVFENYRVDQLTDEQWAGDARPSVRARISSFFERTNYPLTVRVMPGRVLSLQAMYETRRFEAQAITRMIGHFKMLLQGMANNPDRRPSELAILSDAELSLLKEWNGVEADYSSTATIDELFEAQVELAPDAVALVFEDQQLSYSELNGRANQLAHHLRSLGVGSGALVGIYLERSLELVIGIVATLKAGAAYVPLDPAYPRERLAFMLEDAQVKVLVTDQRLVEELPDVRAQIVCMDKDRGILSRNSDENVVSQTSPDNPAYVIYTSGSTGRPKGVLISHRNVVRLFGATARWYGFDRDDTWTLFHSSAFDFSVWELWGALAYGGRLVVVPYWVTRSSDLFYELLSEERVTVLNQTPSSFRELARTAQIENERGILSLRLVVFGGEALDLSGLRPWFDRYGDERPLLVNMYGITETTVHVTYRPICAQDTLSGSSAVGRPIPDLRAHLLDDRLQPVPAGIAGELYVGGAGVGQGYLNRPDLTAERFIPDPFDDKPGTRLYKSGDLARYRSDGDMEYLGRIDHQVKIRGFRIETGEIESALAEHHDVAQAVVIAREDLPGDKRLVGYITSKSAEGATSRQLRDFLNEKLPAYMIPAAFVVLDSLPLTPSGKVNRRALPAPEQLRPDLEGTFVAPRTSTEQKLAEVWADLLGLERVGVYDNFFELGGHSILAMSLISRLREAFGMDLPVLELFRAPNIADLAEVIDLTLTRQEDVALESASESSPYWTPIVALQPRGSKRPFFMVHAASGSVFCFTELAHKFDLDRPLYGLQARGLVDGQTPSPDIETMAADYVAAIRSVQPEGPYLLGGWSMGGVIAYEMARQLLMQGQRVALLAQFDSVPSTAYAGQDEQEQSRLLLSFAQHLGLSSEHLSDSLGTLMEREAEEQLACILKEYGSAQMLPPDIDLKQVHRLFQVFKTNLEALRSYVSQPVPVRVTLLSAAERFAGDLCDATHGWDRLATEGVEVYKVAGNHFSMVRRPHVAALCDRLRLCIESREYEE